MKSDIQNYLKLQAALTNEKAKLEARLSAINKVLGGEVSVAAAPAAATRGGKRTFSAATKAKMAKAQKARWAKKKGNVALKAAVDASPAPKKGKRTMSEATKAKMRASHQARWAKKKGTPDATKAPAAVPATPSAPAPKKKRKYSAEAKAKMAAGAMKRWAKVAAAKVKTGK